MSVYHEVIECIPSSALRNYLRTNEINLSVMQMATIVDECAVKKKRIALFRKLRDIAGSEAERLLLDTAIKDMRAASELYLDIFPHEGFPILPFLEICNLPVLFKSGDIIRSHESFHNALYCVGTGPVLIEGHSDFSDECYLCYPLSYPVKVQRDLALSHVHINICYADRASVHRLTKKQIMNLIRIRELINSNDYELKRFK